MTSVTPATSATSRCVLFSPLMSAATYSAAEAMPVGPRPEVNSTLCALSMISTLLLCVSAVSFSALANLAM